MRLDPILTAVNADTLASRIDKKKSSPEKCIFFLPIRFHLTLILKPQRPNACPIVTTLLRVVIALLFLTKIKSADDFELIFWFIKKHYLSVALPTASFAPQPRQ